jgi:hypothetical protein
MQARHRPEGFRPDLPAGYLPRSSFLLLTNLTVGTYTSLMQRGQMPAMPPPPDAPAFVLQELGYKVHDSELDFDARGWAPGSALAFIVAQMFVDQHTCSRDLATAVARGTAFMSRHSRWAKVTAAADRLISGRQHANFLIAARSEGDKRQAAIGTLAEIGEEWGDAENLIAVSLTQAAATLRRRASEHGIDIAAFWKTGQ